MDLSPKKLKKDASLCLTNAAYPPKKLSALFSGISLGASVMVMLANLLLDWMIENTGGLSDLGLRTVLGTVQFCLSAVVTILLPFWTMGFVSCALHLARQAPLSSKDLLDGLRRWGVILRYALAQALIFFVLCYLVCQVVGMVYLFSPASENLLVAMDQISSTGEITQKLLRSLLPTLLPLYIFSGLFLLLLAVPIFYRLRLATYRILDEDRPGALQALSQSRRLMKGNCMALFLLDLSYWWYYMLSALLGILPWVSDWVSLPGFWGNGDWLYAGSYILYALGMFVLQYFAIAKMQTTYCLFYDKVMDAQAPAPTLDTAP